jgi:hypothetical protein
MIGLLLSVVITYCVLNFDQGRRLKAKFGTKDSYFKNTNIVVRNKSNQYLNRVKILKAIFLFKDYIEKHPKYNGIKIMIYIDDNIVNNQGVKATGIVKGSYLDFFFFENTYIIGLDNDDIFNRSFDELTIANLILHEYFHVFTKENYDMEDYDYGHTSEEFKLTIK